MRYICLECEETFNNEEERKQHSKTHEHYGFVLENGQIYIREKERTIK